MELPIYFRFTAPELLFAAELTDAFLTLQFTGIWVISCFMAFAALTLILVWFSSYLSIYLSICLSIYLSTYLSFFIMSFFLQGLLGSLGPRSADMHVSMHVFFRLVHRSLLDHYIYILSLPWIA